jgi:hypothetical protein
MNNPDKEQRVARRKAFNEMKKTPEFARWRISQMRLQEGNCAWCRKPMRDGMKIHVDHALPLYQGGTNRYGNLVLSHGKCNMEKWIRVDDRPRWIENREDTIEKNKKLRDIRREQRKLARQIIDQHIWDTYLSWLKDER